MPDTPHQLLLDKRAEVEAELAELERLPSDQGSISFGKRIGEGTSMAVDRLSQVAVHEKLQRTRDDLDRALAKLAEDSYGACDVCGRPIAPARLDALPWAVRCVDDAAR